MSVWCSLPGAPSLLALRMTLPSALTRIFDLDHNQSSPNLSSAYGSRQFLVRLTSLYASFTLSDIAACLLDHNSNGPEISQAVYPSAHHAQCIVSRNSSTKSNNQRQSQLLALCQCYCTCLCRFSNPTQLLAARNSSLGVPRPTTPLCCDPIIDHLPEDIQSMLSTFQRRFGV